MPIVIIFHVLAIVLTFAMEPVSSKAVSTHAYSVSVCDREAVRVFTASSVVNLAGIWRYCFNTQHTPLVTHRLGGTA